MEQTRQTDREVRQLERRIELTHEIRELRNRQDFLEVVATIWPFKRVIANIDHLQARLKHLEKELRGEESGPRF